MREYLDGQRHWPEWSGCRRYAPELKPVEGLWGTSRGGDLARGM